MTCRSPARRQSPVFASDISGAEWKVAAEVRAGAIVLVLTAPDQSGGGSVELVTITNPGSGYTSPPTVSFSAPPPGGAAATGTAVGARSRRLRDGRHRRQRLHVPPDRQLFHPAVRRRHGNRHRGGRARQRRFRDGRHRRQRLHVPPDRHLLGSAVRRHHGNRHRGGRARQRRFRGRCHPRQRLHVPPDRQLFRPAVRRRHGNRHRGGRARQRRFRGRCHPRQRLHLGPNRHLLGSACRRHHGNRHRGGERSSPFGDGHERGYRLRP